MNITYVVYQDSNLDQETTVRVVRRPDGVFAVQMFDGIGVDMGRLAGVRTVWNDVGGAIRYARRIVADDVLLGDSAPL